MIMLVIHVQNRKELVMMEYGIAINVIMTYALTVLNDLMKYHP